MEEHFLKDLMSGEPQFRAEPWFNPDGDCVVFQIANEAIVADRIDELLTVYRSAIDNRPIGFQIKGVTAIIKKFGFDGLAWETEVESGRVRSISISALLLAAYEQGPRTLMRRRAYASVMDFPSQRRAIPTEELQLA